MAKVYLTREEFDLAKEQNNPNVAIDSLLRRFKKQVKRDEIIEDVKKHEFFLKKSLRRREKAKRNRIKALMEK